MLTNGRPSKDCVEPSRARTATPDYPRRRALRQHMRMRMREAVAGGFVRIAVLVAALALTGCASHSAAELPPSSPSTGSPNTDAPTTTLALVTPPVPLPRGVARACEDATKAASDYITRPLNGVVSRSDIKPGSPFYALLATSLSVCSSRREWLTAIASTAESNAGVSPAQIRMILTAACEEERPSQLTRPCR